VTLNFPKTLLILLICLTFVGQAMASTLMSYQMMNMNGMKGQTHDMSQMDHSVHKMFDDSSLNESAELNDDCCAQECNCSISGCFSIIALPKTVNHDPVLNTTSKIITAFDLTKSLQLKSLYRPPIFN